MKKLQKNLQTSINLSNEKPYFFLYFLFNFLIKINTKIDFRRFK